MSLETSLALKFLISKKRKGFLSAAAAVSIFGLAFGVAALLVSLSIITGFQKEYKKAILGFNSHLILMSADEISRPDNVAESLSRLSVGGKPSRLVGWSPFIYREGMTVTGRQVKGVVLKGVDLDRLGRLSSIRIRPASDSILDKNKDRLPALYLGAKLAKSIFPNGGLEDGQVLRVLFPRAEGGDHESARSVKRFFVAGTFESGLYDYDASFSFLDLKDAERFFQTGGKVSGLELWLDDPERAEDWATVIRRDFEFPNVVLTWRELNENVFRALELEKVIFYLLMTVLIGIASLNVLGTLMMLLLEKRSELAVLRVCGMSWKRLRKVFLFDGLLIGSVGVALGVLLGGGLLLVLDRFQPIQLEAEVYFLNKIPVVYSKNIFLGVVGSALGIIFIGCELALRRVSRASGAKGLRALLEG